MTRWGRGGRGFVAGALLVLCHCLSEATTAANVEKTSAEAPPPPSSTDRPADAAALVKDGRELGYAKVLVRRLPFSDAALFSFVNDAASCDLAPKPGDANFVAEMLVTRFFAQEGAAPSRRPLMVKRLTVGSAVMDGPFPIREPFIEPTTATVMFGTVDITKGGVSLRGNVMAEVCLPPAADEREQVSSEFFLSYMGARVRARGAIVTGSQLRISTAPLRCGDAPHGDLEVTLDTKTSAVAIDGFAVTPKSGLEGSAKAVKSGSAFEVDVKGSLGGALEVRGSLTPVACPR